MAGKKTQGRKKIEMKKIEDADVRRITFSKRRSGLFKKASELTTLCGIQIAIIVYSIGGKAFSFGHPSIEAVINRFEGKAQQQEDYIERYANSIRDSRLRALNQQFNYLNGELAEERNKRKNFRRCFQDFGCRSFEDFIDNLGAREREQAKEKMQNFKEYLSEKVCESHGERSVTPTTVNYLNKIGETTEEVYGSPAKSSTKNCEFNFPTTGERVDEGNASSAKNSSKHNLLIPVKNKVNGASIPRGWLKL